MHNTNTSFSITGMTCASCERIITKRVQKISGVSEVHVSAISGMLSIDASRPIPQSEVEIALENTHYKIINNL